MSMYDMIKGNSKETAIRGIVFQALLSLDGVGRYRDAWAEKDGDDITLVIFTRNGGGNRQSEDLQGDIEAMQQSPYYIRDEDCNYDCTYAAFYFRCPEPQKEYMGRFAVEPVDTSEMFADNMRSFIEALSHGIVEGSDVP